MVGPTGEDGDRVGQQDEIDAETTRSAEVMGHPVPNARDRHLDRREAALDERARRLDRREAGLDERETAQVRRDGAFEEWKLQADLRDAQADQREINAQTTWPDH